ncbi:MAG: copper amine oxidase N-terminal domain-containing protein, partial [Firmicutes bacterium]|nr:copper amine oxidase N-terminal domain-containing protein [Bacillota bacterium]
MPARPASSGPDQVTVFVHGNRGNFDVPPQGINDRTLVPIRAVAERIGATVIWLQEEHSVVVSRGDLVVRVNVGSRTAWRNGQAVTLDQPAIIVGDRTLVPVRFVSEGLGARVSWVGEARSVLINSGEASDLALFGYYVQYNGDDRLSYNALRAQGKNLDYVIAFQYALNAGGVINTTYDPVELLAYARAQHKKVLALVHNIGASGNFDQGIAHRLQRT